MGLAEPLLCTWHCGGCSVAIIIYIQGAPMEPEEIILKLIIRISNKLRVTTCEECISNTTSENKVSQYQRILLMTIIFDCAGRNIKAVKAQITPTGMVRWWTTVKTRSLPRLYESILTRCRHSQTIVESNLQGQVVGPLQVAAEQNFCQNGLSIPCCKLRSWGV